MDFIVRKTKKLENLGSKIWKYYDILIYLYLYFYVIFCTGYFLNYPFMEEKLRHSGKLLYYHENLYKVFFSPNFNDNLFVA